VRATRLLALCFSDTALTTRGGSLLIAPRAVKPKQPKIPRLIKFRQRPRIMFEPGFRFGSRAAVEAGLIVRPVSPQLRKCRLRSHSLRLAPQTDIAWSSAVPPGGKLAPPRSAVASDWLRSLGCRRGSWLTHSGVNVKARTTSSIWRPFFGDWPLNSHRLISTGIASSPMKLARSTGWYRQVAN